MSGITNGCAQAVSSNLYDLFGVLRYEQGNAQTPWRWKREGDKGMVFVGERGYLINAAVFTSSPFDDIVRGLICEWACAQAFPHGPDYLRRACVEFYMAYGKKPAPSPSPVPAPQPPSKKAKCEKGECKTNVPTDIASCCPDGRPFCGPAKDYFVICGVSVTPPAKEPPQEGIR